MNTLKLTVEIPLDRVASLLCCAFEGGSNYWYMIEDFKAPALFDFQLDADPTRPDHTPALFRHIDYPLNPGGALRVSDAKAVDQGEKKTTKTLSLRSIEDGLRIFAAEQGRHFGDFMAGNEDATTGDVFLQCCLFGEVVYG